VQLAMWPDAPPSKARSNYDNLLSRFRKVIAKWILPADVRDYLVVGKGMVALENCRIDAEEFKAWARKALDHYKKQQYWRADCCFNLAFREWEGEFFRGVYLGEEVAGYQEELLTLYREGACCWADVLLRLGLPHRAVAVLEKAFPYAPTDKKLVRQLYGLYAHVKQPSRARELFRRYEKALRRAGFTDEEIYEELDGLWAN